MIPTRGTQQSSPATSCCCLTNPTATTSSLKHRSPQGCQAGPRQHTKSRPKATSVQHQESNNPARPQVRSFSAQTSPRTRNNGAVPSLGTLRGGCRLGLKVYISSPTGQKTHSLHLPRTTHSANREGKATAKPNKSSIVSHSEEVHGFFVVGHQLGLMG